MPHPEPACRNTLWYYCALGTASTMVTALCHTVTAGASEAAEAAQAPHPERRVAASPAGGIAVSCNPPSLLGPVGSRSRVGCEVRLSQTANFSDPGTIRSGGLRWAMFNPRCELTGGPWYWQYRVVRDGAKESPWSRRFQFVVKDQERP